MSAPAATFPHHVGDGRHLITDTFIVFDNGSCQFGDPSDVCVILHAHMLCTTFRLPSIWALWTEVYPNDPMDRDDAACILSEAKPFTAPCDPTNREDRAAILLDLRAIGCEALALHIQLLLADKGILC